MWGKICIGVVKQRIVSFWWFLCHHVCAVGSNLSFFERIGNSLTIYQWSASCVDKDSGGKHHRQCLGIDEMERAVIKRTMEGKYIARSQQVV